MNKKRTKNILRGINPKIKTPHEDFNIDENLRNKIVDKLVSDKRIREWTFACKIKGEKIDEKVEKNLSNAAFDSATAIAKQHFDFKKGIGESGSHLRLLFHQAVNIIINQYAAQQPAFTETRFQQIMKNARLHPKIKALIATGDEQIRDNPTKYQLEINKNILEASLLCCNEIKKIYYFSEIRDLEENVERLLNELREEIYNNQ